MIDRRTFGGLLSALLMISSSRIALASSTSMTDDRFWGLIATTVAEEANPDAQIVALRAALDRLTAEEIVEFDVAYGRQLRQAYTWKLWGAAYVIHGGESDDGFEYFRSWLISKGRVVFESVIADPDSLADLLPADVAGVLEFEEFAYVAGAAWAAKTGKAADAIPSLEEATLPGSKPDGTPFPQSDAGLARVYPKLWRRFGQSPLG